jgi:hypothetical protein
VTTVARDTVTIRSDNNSEPARAFEQNSVTMPSSLEAPVLQVDANVIHKVDTTNPANLFSMWTGKRHHVSFAPTDRTDGALE